jgi:hypothetical protein
VVVDAGVNKKQRGRPLLEVDGEVCSKNYLTGPTLLEMSGKPTYQELASFEHEGYTSSIISH